MKFSYFSLFLILSMGIAAQSPGLTVESSLTSQPLYAGPIEFVSLPDQARVVLSGILWGQTPVTIAELNPGNYTLEVRLEGYKPFTADLTLESGKAYKIFTKLEISTGFLEIKSMKSWETLELYSSQTLLEPISPGLYKLPIGNHTLDLKVFGFTPVGLKVEIKADEVLSVAPNLNPAEFKILSLNIWPRVINPENPGDLGSLKLTFSVSAPGNPVLQISTTDGQILLNRTLGPFSTWNQNLTLREELETWPQGLLNLEISDSETKFSTNFEVQNSYDLNLRSQGPGGSTLGVALLSDTLPPLGFRISSQGGIIMESGLPRWELGAFGAMGLGSGFEVGLGIQKAVLTEVNSYLKVGTTWGFWSSALGISGNFVIPSGLRGDVFGNLGFQFGPLILGISSIVTPFPLPLGSLPLEIQGVVAWEGDEFISGVNGSYNFTQSTWKILWSTVLLLPGSGAFLGLNPGVQSGYQRELYPYFSLEAGFFQ